MPDLGTRSLTTLVRDYHAQRRAILDQYEADKDALFTAMTQQLRALEDAYMARLTAASRGEEP